MLANSIINLIKKSIKSVMDNPSITLFLVLFLIISNFLGACIVSAKLKIVAFVILFCFFVFIAAFLSGWFCVIKESIDIDKIKEKNYYSIFFEGVGKNTLSVFFGIILYSVLMFLVLFLTREIAHHFFGGLDFLFKDMQTLALDNKSAMEYLKSLTTDQKYTIYAWQLTFLCVMTVFHFFFLFYFPALICKDYQDILKNIFLRPICALYSTLKFIFKNFFPVLGLYILIQISHFILAFLNAIFAANMFLSVLLLFLYIYFASFVVMLIFNYYDSKNNCQKDNCNHGCDSIGQNETCN